PPDGRLRAPPLTNPNLPPHDAEIARSATTTPRQAPHRSAATASRPQHSLPQSAPMRRLRTRQFRQIPIAPKPRPPSHGFFPAGLSDAGPSAGRHVDDRHPKPFSEAAIRERPNTPSIIVG